MWLNSRTKQDLKWLENTILYLKYWKYMNYVGFYLHIVFLDFSLP